MTGHLEHHFDLRRCVPMDRAEEHRCASEYARTRAPLLAERLITANLRLVVAIAKGYRRGDRDIRDLVQEGNLGLIHAVGLYDPDRGVKLCSYAAWWIRAYILKYTMSSWRLVKAGTTQAQRRLFFRLQRERSRLEINGVHPDTKQLASALRVREKDVVTMLERFAGGETSFDAPSNPQQIGTRTIADSLSADQALRPDSRVEAAEFERSLHEKLMRFGQTLRGRERSIYRKRLWTDEPVTLSHLAVDFGVTRERTRQLEQRLKGRIREYLQKELGDAVAQSQAPA